MCLWGLAHTYGPFLNEPQKSSEDLSMGLSAAKNASAALALSPHSPKERALIEAMAVRYPEDGRAEEQLTSYRRYAARLRELREASAELKADVDLMAFHAEALMVLMCDSLGCHYYASRGDSLPPVPLPTTEEASALLRAALKATEQMHAYAQHLLIHSTEMSNWEAQTALTAAQQLAKNMAPLQDQHLQHMSSHTFGRTGRYHDAVMSNVVAVRSDAAYMHHGLVPYGPGHDSVFLVCAALWGGERAAAYKYAKVVREIYTKYPSMPDSPDGSMAWNHPMVVPLRFGDWDNVRQLDSPPPGNFSVQWPYGYGVVRHFSLAVAAAHLGRLRDADAHVSGLRNLMPSVAATKTAKLISLAHIANHTASAVVAHERGHLELSVEALRLAVEVEMAMPYDEPPSWLLPTRECYGLALMHAGRPEDAEATFRSALYGYSWHAEPHCGWALLGLRMSLSQQQPTPRRLEEIENITQHLDHVWQHADVPIRTPCSILGSEPMPAFV